MAKPQRFTVIIPTYSGEEHLDAMLQSLLNQHGKHVYDVLVVIDGPNERLRQIAESNLKRFKKHRISFTIRQFDQNQGRFFARLEGAKLAKTKTLLFADDRNMLDPNYINELVAANEKVIIPNVIQVNNNSAIARVLYMVRKFLYRAWGDDFEPYYITEANFEKSSKGTTGLWVDRQTFVDICKRMADGSHDLKSVNEDTKILKDLIAGGGKIFRSSAAKVYYQPRTGLKNELKHLYERGPRFVDYYLRPGTRFFGPLALMIIGLLLIPVLAVLAPKVLLYAAFGLLVGLLVFAVAVSRKPADFVLCLWAVPLMAIVFMAGVLRGMARKFLHV